MLTLSVDTQRYLEDLYRNDEIGFQNLMKRKEDLLASDKPEDEAIGQAIYEYQTNRLDVS